MALRLISQHTTYYAVQLRQLQYQYLYISEIKKKANKFINNVPILIRVDLLQFLNDYFSLVSFRIDLITSICLIYESLIICFSLYFPFDNLLSMINIQENYNLRMLSFIIYIFENLYM